MSICKKGFGCKVVAKDISIKVKNNDPLIKLANLLPWNEMLALIEPDLKSTTKKGFWNRGRKLKVRIHLGAYILQKLHNYKDRETETLIKNNAAYQLFCGLGIVAHWHCPDHTKIESFRSRLKPETQRALANLMSITAVKLGFADPSEFDVDSTVQEANITYPTDAKMLKKLAKMACKITKAIGSISEEASNIIVDIKAIAKNARAIFFKSKRATNEEKSALLKTLWKTVESPVKETIFACQKLSSDSSAVLSWNIKRAINQLCEFGEKYLKDSLLYIETGRAVANKALSFHAKDVECFTKGKDHQKYAFGRAYQLGRVAGNFLFVAECHDIEMNDKRSVIPMLETHQEIFSSAPMKSIAMDKGYYSKKNIEAAINKGCNKVGIQKPHTAKFEDVRLSEEEKIQLANRRAGIEPLIGHTKQGGQLGRSRMKSDVATLAAGYASVLGFNLRQLLRRVAGAEAAF